MTDMLPTDTYYRGYRLSRHDGQVHVYKDADHLTTKANDQEAKGLIDHWVEGAA